MNVPKHKKDSIFPELDTVFLFKELMECSKCNNSEPTHFEVLYHPPYDDLQIDRAQEEAASYFVSPGVLDYKNLDEYDKPRVFTVRHLAHLGKKCKICGFGWLEHPADVSDEEIDNYENVDLEAKAEGEKSMIELQEITDGSCEHCGVARGLVHKKGCKVFNNINQNPDVSFPTIHKDCDCGSRAVDGHIKSCPAQGQPHRNRPMTPSVDSEAFDGRQS